MRQFILSFIVCTLWSSFGIWYYTCQVKALCPSLKTVEVPKEDPKLILERKLIANSHHSFSLEHLQRVEISKNNTTVKFNDVDSLVRQQIFNFLNKNQQKELILTGYYHQGENDSLGLQRANSLKQLLVNYGINKDKVLVSKDSLNFDYDSKGFFIAGIGIDYQDIPEERLAAFEKTIANKTLYSSFNSKEFHPDNSLQAYALELKNYLEKYGDQKVTVTGHTDSQGKEIDNEWFGMVRAKEVSAFLISQGIDKERLIIVSKGELEPIADNRTEEGRAKNRRTEIKAN